jgi:hypothetical protein
MLSIAPVGPALSTAGTAWILLVDRFLLPNRRDSQASVNRFRLSNV